MRGNGDVAAHSPTDDELMTRYVNDDVRAFEVLYGRHKDAVYRYFLRQVDVASAADALQDTWARVIAARKRYRPSGQFTAYLFTIAHNVLMDHHRRSMKTVEEPDTLEDTASPATHLEAARAEDRLKILIGRLPVSQRDVLVMHKESGLSLRAIAEITGASEEAVKSRFRYAMSKLKQGMHTHVQAN